MIDHVIVVLLGIVDVTMEVLLEIITLQSVSGRQVASVQIRLTQNVGPNPESGGISMLAESAVYSVKIDL